MKDRSKSAAITPRADQQKRVKLTPELIEGFVETYLVDTFEGAYDIPEFHRELWKLSCSEHPFVALAAPRGHAKSTAGNYAFTLAATLFGVSDFVLLLSSTEELASVHLRNIRNQLADNPGIAEDFEIKLEKDNATDLWFTTHGRRVIILARGAEQKIRGANIDNKRPSLIICDDMEDDEMVMNDERRYKFRQWFKNAVLPIGSDHALFRVLGTILHLDSFLERLLNSRSWLSARFKAHKDFDDFSEILWPEKFSEERLRRARQVYIDDGDTNGYCQEYLCYPINKANGYFRETMFVSMEPDDHLAPKYYYVAVDFAISESQRADFTAMAVAGIDSDGFIHIVDFYTFKGDGPEIIDQLFIIQKRWKPEFFIFENGQISKSLGGFLRDEIMRRSRTDRDAFLNYLTVTPHQKKEVRARSIQKRMQIGGVKFNTNAEWYEMLKTEMTSFPRAPHDDQVDAMAYIGMYLDKLIESPTDDQIADQEWEEEMAQSLMMMGRSETTGY